MAICKKNNESFNEECNEQVTGFALYLIPGVLMQQRKTSAAVRAAVTLHQCDTFWLDQINLV